MNKLAGAIAALVLLAGCSKQNEQRAGAPIVRQAPESTPVRVPQPPAPQRPAIDPRSKEAAEQLVGAFIELLNARKFDGAYMLLGQGGPPRARFDAEFSRYSDLRVSAGEAGNQEGAAGSIYLSVPLTIAGTSDGKRVNRSATAVLRRVNDVPGSTEAQRHWHIERIDWTA